MYVAYDIDRIRAEFPGLSRMEGERSAIFFDNPAGTQVTRASMDRMVDAMIHANANLGGFFTTTRLAAENVAAAHAAAADFVNAADPDEVFFGQNMTSLTFAFSRAIGRMLRPGDEIIVSRMDHDANIAPWLMLAEDRGLVVKWFEFNTNSFEFDLSWFGTLLSSRTKVVAIGYASNLTGTINNISTIARKAHAVGAFVYVDAVQFAPHGVVDVQAIDCDVLVCSAYKFFGPHYGLAWARRSLQEQLTAYKVRPASDDLPFKFVTGTTNREELAGVRGAIEYYAWVGQTLGTPASNSRRDCIVAGVKAMAAYEKPLMARLIDGLQALPGVRIFGITDPAAFDRRVPTVSFRVGGFTTEEIVRHMAQRGIYLWHGDNYAIEPCRALGILDDGGVVRVGLAHYNRMDEVERFLKELADFIDNGVGRRT
jgi:cysteine desulfurase family protein (TIGR01976 family)